METPAGKPLIYLACPYTHAHREVRLRRFEAANRAAAALLNQGLVIFSPISHTHPIADQCSLPCGWEFWQTLDRAYLSCSSAIYVLSIDGWKESVGVQAELAIAREMGLPVRYVNESGDVSDEPLEAGGDLLAVALAEIEDLRDQVSRFKSRDLARRTIESAKWLLVQRHKISEPAAYKLIQKQASRTNTKIEEVCAMIVAAGEMEAAAKGTQHENTKKGQAL